MGANALIWVASSGYTKIVKILIKKQVDLNAKTEFGTTALNWAREKEFADIAKLLGEKQHQG